MLLADYLFVEIIAQPFSCLLRLLTTFSPLPVKRSALLARIVDSLFPLFSLGLPIAFPRSSDLRPYFSGCLKFLAQGEGPFCGFLLEAGGLAF